MKLLCVIVILGLVAMSLALPVLSPRELNRHFDGFKEDFSRSYRSSMQELARKLIFARNLDYIMRHNMEADQGIHSYRLAVNNFTDLANIEFQAMVNGLSILSQTQKKTFWPFIDTGVWTNKTVKAPETVDWTTKGVVTPVKNQGQCGSCWAFSAVATIESQHALKTGKLIALSEQNLVDCATKQGNEGCNGGIMDWAFKYVIENGGISTEKSYPYKGRNEKCQYRSDQLGATIKGYKDLPRGDEKALEKAVAEVGPIAVAIDAGHLSFQFYSSGVYDDRRCSSQDLNHGVTLVGYGKLDGKDYWKVKNSWGTNWGEKGYIRMSKNKNNQCGIATMASYPVV